MKKILIAALKFYRGWISPAMPGSCRFAPSCSAYALVALERHGAFRGAALTARRILRCHPFNPGGYDPVPEEVQDSKFQISNSRYNALPVWNLPFDKAQGPEPVEGESGIWNLIQRKKHHG